MSLNRLISVSTPLEIFNFCSKMVFSEMQKKMIANVELRKVIEHKVNSLKPNEK